MITSINFHSDLRLIEEGHTIVYNYSKMKLYGNISFSYLIIIIFFIYAIFINRNIKFINDKELKKFMKMLIILFLTSFFIGLIGIIFDNYDLGYFIQSFLYFIHILVDLFLLMKLYDKNDIKILKRLIYSLLIATVLVSIICTVIGFSGNYGGVVKLASLDIYGYTPMLILLLLSKNNFSVGILGVISIYMGKDIFNGKEIASTSFVLLIFIYTVLKFFFSKIMWKKRRAFVILLIFLFFLFIGKNKIMAKFEDSGLLKSKFQQFISLFFIYKNFDKIPNSPKIRVIQLINIFLEYLKKPYMLVFGLGNGSYYLDPYNLFSTVDISTGAYKQSEILTRRYIYTHDTFSTLFKQHGIYGIYFLIKWLFYFLKKIKYERLAIIPFLWLILVYGFNNYQVILFVMITSFVLFLEIKNNN
ncbi:hypothetical protein [Fusobacterium animalis]|uniref:hypothetical protein n=1 Tax=Fusobacterium animalis TaxID=76859 RepID=UPI0030CE0BC6